MIVDDTADVEQRAWFQLTHFPHELVGLFGIGSATLLVRVEPVGRIERVFQVLFKLIDRANPLQNLVGGNGFRLAAHTGHEIRLPFIRTADVTDDILGDKLEHALGQDMVDQYTDMMLALLVVDLGAIIEETVVALRKRALVQIVVLVHPGSGNLKNLAVHNIEFLCVELSFSSPLLKAFRLPRRERFYMQDTQRENEGKASKQPGDFTEYPTRQARQGGEPEVHLRFAEGCRSIRRPVSKAVLDDRNNAVPSHGKIPPTGMPARREAKEYYLYKRMGATPETKRGKRQREG